MSWPGHVTWYSGGAGQRQETGRSAGPVVVFRRTYLTVDGARPSNLGGCVAERGTQRGEVCVALSQPPGHSCKVSLESEADTDAFLELCLACAAPKEAAKRPLPSPARSAALPSIERSCKPRWCTPTPDFAGRIAEFLWDSTAAGQFCQEGAKRRRVLQGVDIMHLLQCSRSVQVDMILGIKERRVFLGQAGDTASLNQALEDAEKGLVRAAHVEASTQRRVDGAAEKEKLQAQLQAQLAAMAQKAELRLALNAICDTVRNFLPRAWHKQRNLQLSVTEEEDYKVAADMICRHMMASRVG